MLGFHQKSLSDIHLHRTHVAKKIWFQGCSYPTGSKPVAFPNEKVHETMLEELDRNGTVEFLFGQFVKRHAFVVFVVQPNVFVVLCVSFKEYVRLADFLPVLRHCGIVLGNLW